MDRNLKRNISIHNKIAKKYNSHHLEIYNAIEQTRLKKELKNCIKKIHPKSNKLRAFDFGCGTGNLTKHLLDLGFNVTSADVSLKSLELVDLNYANKNLSTLLLEEGSLSKVKDNSFDLVATYSVLHHITDYINACKELVRICKPGGIIFIDHERNNDFWSNKPEYKLFLKNARKFDFKKYLRLSNYYNKFIRLFNPRHTNEGDIHVWHDDHIEWDLIKSETSETTSIIREKDYLLYSDIYKKDVFETYEGKISDTKLLILRKN